MNRQPQDYLLVLAVAGICLFVLGGLALELSALYHCGWSGVLYGRNVFWAYMLGYCNG